MAMSRSVTAFSHLALLSLLALAAAPSLAQGRFTMSADGAEVHDATTQLTWRRCVEGMHWDGKGCTGKATRFSYASAKKAAAGASPWRVPAREELRGLVDRTARKKPRIDREAFPNTPSLPTWASRAGTDDNLNAWLVSFSSGKVQGNTGQAKFPLRLVRSSP